MAHETVYLYNGALLDSDGDCATPIPHLFQSIKEAQEWADAQGMSIRVVVGARRGDALIEKPSKHCSCTRFGLERQGLSFGEHMEGCPLNRSVPTEPESELEWLRRTGAH